MNVVLSARTVSDVSLALAGPFVPARGMRNPHVQTILADKLPRRFPRGEALLAPWRNARREVEFELPDGDRLLGHLHLHPDDPGRTRPLVLHLHGLEGCADSHYQVGLSVKAFAAGFHSLRLNFRLCGDTEHLARRPYHGRRTEDVLSVLSTLRETWGFGIVHATAVSMGGGLLLRLLADAGEQPPTGLGAVVAISPAIDYRASFAVFYRGFNRVYANYFLRLLKRKVRRMARVGPGRADVMPLLPALRRVHTLGEYDALITAPLCGFPGPGAYYDAASSADDLGRIRVPTLILTAQDDPMIPFSSFEDRRDAIAANPNLSTLFPPHGGHAGFLAERPKQPHPWMDGRWGENVAIAYLAAR